MNDTEYPTDANGFPLIYWPDATSGPYRMGKPLTREEFARLSDPEVVLRMREDHAADKWAAEHRPVFDRRARTVGSRLFATLRQQGMAPKDARWIADEVVLDILNAFPEKEVV